MCDSIDSRPTDDHSSQRTVTRLFVSQTQVWVSNLPLPVRRHPHKHDVAHVPNIGVWPRILFSPSISISELTRRLTTYVPEAPPSIIHPPAPSSLQRLPHLVRILGYRTSALLSTLLCLRNFRNGLELVQYLWERLGIVHQLLTGSPHALVTISS